MIEWLTWLAVIFVVLTLIADFLFIIGRRVKIFWAFLTPVFLVILLNFAGIIHDVIEKPDFIGATLSTFYFGVFWIFINTAFVGMYLFFTKEFSVELSQKLKISVWVILIASGTILVAVTIPQLIRNSKLPTPEESQRQWEETRKKNEVLQVELNLQQQNKETSKIIDGPRVETE